MRGAILTGAILTAPPMLGQGVDAELEGPITAIDTHGTGPATISVMGVPIINPRHLLIDTPVTEISASDLLGPPLPGRDQPGFLGGTGIILARTQDGITTAFDVFVEPAENVLIGRVTANENGHLSILDVPVELIEDWRMLGVAKNEAGFLIDLTTVEVGSFAVAEGYLGLDSVFHAYIIEADGVILGPINQTSITRAICRQYDRLQVRGGSTTPTSIVNIYNDETNELLGSAFIFPDFDNPPLGEFRFRIDIREGMECPFVVRAENSNGSFATSEVEIDD